MPRSFVVFLAALVANMVIGIVVVLAGGWWPQWSILLIVLAALAYVAVVDPMNRWPDSSWHRRLGRVLTFKRGGDQ